MRRTVFHLRLGSGLVLFAFVAMHMLNHALGIASLEAMEWGRRGFLLLWRSTPGTVLLYGAVLLHVLLVGYAVYRRRSLRMPLPEALQVLFGLAIPPLLAAHLVSNRLAHEVLGLEDTYAYVLLSLWVWDWRLGVLQTVATLVTWLHGCLGIYFWLRLKPWYPRWQGWLLSAALLFPALGLAGFASGGKEAMLRAQDVLWERRQVQAMNLPGPEGVVWAESTAGAVRMGALAFAAGVLGARLGRIAWQRRRGRYTVTYPDGRQGTMEAGVSVLEASRAVGVPHASVCGGRGRCSTCRVRVVEGWEHLPAPQPAELGVLERVRAGERVRLACQLRPVRDLAVVPLLPPNASPREGFRRPAYLNGSEREIAVLFADLRSFTRFSERKLPYDLVFIINQYFRSMGTAVEKSGGHLDKFIGDGVMALFGIESDLKQGCRTALTAAQAMSEALAELNRHLAPDLDEPLRIGIGIHAGPAIVGEMGFAHAISLTAIGDTVNTASRIEGMSKDFQCELVVSEAVALAAGADLSPYPRHAIQVRGRDEPLVVYAVLDAKTMSWEPAGAA